MDADTQSVCRLCLREEKPGGKKAQRMRSIFTMKYTFIETMISILKIERDDTVSISICQKCVNKIKYINAFLVKCEEANNVLKSRKNWEIKIEPSDGNINEITSKVDIFNVDEQDRKFKVENRVDDMNDDVKRLKSNNENDLWDDYTTVDCATDGEAECKVEKEDLESENIAEKGTNKSAKKGSKKNVAKVKRKRLKPSEKKEGTESKKKKFSSNFNQSQLCHTCGISFMSRNMYHRHLERHKNKIFRCDMCPRTFNDKHYLTRHVHRHTQNERYPCKFCDKLFKNKRYATQHEEIKHIKTKADIICPVCGKAFMAKSYLRVHMVCHNGVPNVQCHICSKTFIRKGALRKHLTFHSDVRPFTCMYCPNAFKTIEHKKKHERLHTGETPHKCPVCLKGFAQKCNMKSHFVHNHKELDFKLTMLEFENRIKFQKEAPDI